MKTYTQDEIQDEILGKVGTTRRDKFEFELQMEIIGSAIKKVRRHRKLTQEQLGSLIGVRKAQISRIESNASNITMETLVRVFNALHANISFVVDF